MQRTVASLALSAFVACTVLACFMSWQIIGQPSPAEAQTTGTCPNAQFIDTFVGNGDQQTDTFDTTTNSLRITFSVTGAASDPASLSIYVIDANDPDQLSVGNASQDGDGQGETFVNAPAGTYFLDISFFALGDGANYTITVEQCEGGNPSQGTPDNSASPIASTPPSTPPSSPPATTPESPPASASPVNSGQSEEATTPETTTRAADQRTQSDEGCANPQPVATFSGTENQVTARFGITGETFRLRYETAPNGPDPFLPTVDIGVLNRNGQPIGEGPLIFEGEDGSENILAGPGTFALEIRAEEASYNVTVEDCVGARTGGRPDPPEIRPGRVDGREGVIQETLVNEIPFTGGPPVVLGALALLGMAVIVGRGVLKR